MAQKMLEDQDMLDQLLSGVHDSDLDFSESEEEEEEEESSSESESEEDSDMEVEPARQEAGPPEQGQQQPQQRAREQQPPPQQQQPQQREQGPPQQQQQQRTPKRGEESGDARPRARAPSGDAGPGPSGQARLPQQQQPQQPQQPPPKPPRQEVTVRAPGDRQQPQSQAAQPIPVIGGGCAPFQIRAPIAAAAATGWGGEQAPAQPLFQHVSPLNRRGDEDRRSGRDRRRREGRERDRESRSKGRNWYRPYPRGSSGARREGGGRDAGQGQGTRNPGPSQGGCEAGPGQAQAAQAARAPRQEQGERRQMLPQGQNLGPRPQQCPPQQCPPQPCPPFPLEALPILRAKFEPSCAVSYTNLVKSIQKIAMPPFLMRRREASPPCHFSKIPQATPGLVIPAAARTGETKFEKFTDAFVQKVIDRGMSPQDCINKTVSVRKLDAKFDALKTFTAKTVNFGQWLDVRKDSIINSGMSTQVVFLEELCAWAKLNLQHGCNLEERDLILHTSETVCSQLMYKLKPIMSCLEPNKPYASMAKQMAYLVCGAGRIQDAGMLLREVKVGSPLTMLVAFSLCVPVMITCRNRNPSLFNYCKSFLDMYQPGLLCALFNTMTSKLNTTCTEEECYASVRAAIGSVVNTRGLLFVPGI
ncbi:multifunctional expression regulator [Equid gammaherpesvirus 2]|nr:multifunctional expression regulator [Equid gammaherpesvirus 2]